MMHELLLAGQALGRMNEVRAAVGISPGLVSSSFSSRGRGSRCATSLTACGATPRT